MSKPVTSPTAFSASRWLLPALLMLVGLGLLLWLVGDTAPVATPSVMEGGQ